jgi:hypothetical protein
VGNLLVFLKLLLIESELLVVVLALEIVSALQDKTFGVLSEVKFEW